MKERLRASKEADATLLAMKKAMGLTGVWNKISRKGRKRLDKKGTIFQDDGEG